MRSVPFAQRGHEIVGIEEVSKGLSCNCCCLSCGARLIAKKGQHQAHHFAHYQGDSCAHALETSLHRYIKALFQRKRCLALPPLYLHRQTSAYLPAQLFRYERVEEEPFLGQIYPDLLLRAGRKTLLLEIKVTHAVPPLKQQKLRRLGLPALEIDTLPLYETYLNRKGAPGQSGFEHSLVHGLSGKQWLFHPLRQKAEFHLRKRSVQRRVKHRRYKGFHQYIAEGCPLGKRRWRSGFRAGQAYANVIQDCMHCPRCLQLEYESAYVGFQETAWEPKTVHCWGHLEAPPRGKPWQGLV